MASPMSAPVSTPAWLSRPRMTSTSAAWFAPPRPTGALMLVGALTAASVGGAAPPNRGLGPGADTPVRGSTRPRGGQTEPMDPMKLADASWPLLKRAFGAHTSLYRLTRGALGHRIPGLPKFLLLEHTGARSG